MGDGTDMASDERMFLVYSISDGYSLLRRIPLLQLMIMMMILLHRSDLEFLFLALIVCALLYSLASSSC